MGENKTFTCQNSSCQRTFSAPLKTLNLQSPSAPYFACPFCLTKVADPTLDETKKPEKNQSPNTFVEEKKQTASEKPSGCRYHMGYLSERAQKQQIPDECLSCKDVVECMLGKMKA
jgi:hypothetical protein